MYEAGRESRVAIESPYFRTDFRCLAVDSVVARVVEFMSVLTLTSSTFHSFFATKIADAIILYVQKVLKTFNRHVNHNCEFTMITGNTLRDHF